MVGRLWPLVLLSFGCKPVDPLPEDLDEVMSSFWLDWREGTDERLGDLAKVAGEVVDMDALLDDADDGAPTRFTDEHLADLEFYAEPGRVGEGVVPDPALAAPMMTLVRIGCSEDQLQEILTYDDQNELYGTYHDYARTFFTSREDYLDGTEDRLEWEGFISVRNAFVGNYTNTFRTDLRRIPVPDDAPELTSDHFFVLRTWIPFPGTFEQEARSFKQDYQLEIWLPWGDGDWVHLYGVWRQMDYGPVGTTEDELVVRTTVNQMVAFDRKTDKLCEDGVP